MATQFNDMALGGSGFAAGYTPIRFAPLVSLTGPITAPAPPAAPEAPVAPMIRPPVYQGDAGDYGGMPATYYGGPPVGERSRGALQADLANAAGFFMNPLGMMANYVLTGQTPAMQFGVGNQREALGLQQSDIMPQGLLPQGLMPQGGMSGLFSGVRDFLFGPQQQSVSLAEAQGGPSAQTLGMAADSATNIANMYGLSPEQAAQVGRTAAGLVAQGMNMTEAITLATNYGAYAARPDVAESAAIGGPQTMAQSMMGGTGQAFGGYTQGGWDDPDRLVDTGGSSIGDSGSFGFDAGGGVGAAPASAAAGMGPGW